MTKGLGIKFSAIIIKSIIIIIFIAGILSGAGKVERGFGYSTIFHLRRSGYDINGDGFADFTAGTLFGLSQYTGGESDFRQVCGFNPSIKDYVEQYCTGDFNGDGMDDMLFSCRIYPTGSLRLIYADGASSAIRYAIDTPELKLLFSGDFNGDGKDEIGYVTGDEEVFIVTPFTDGIKEFTSEFSVKKIYSADINADHLDDLIILYDTPLLKIDILSGGDGEKIWSFDNTNHIGNNEHINFLTLNADDDRDLEILLYGFRNELTTELNSYLSVFDINGTILFNYSDNYFNLPGIDEDSYVYEVKTGDFNLDNYDDIVLLQTTKINGAPGNPVLTAFSGGEWELLFSKSFDESPNILKFLNVQKKNDQQTDAISVLYTPLIISESSVPLFFSFNIDGSTNWEFSFADIYSLGAGYNEKPHNIFRGDFNGDKTDDFLIFSSFGRDINGDSLGDNSIIMLIDGIDGVPAFHHYPFDINSGGYGGYIVGVLENEITDEELFRSINWEISQSFSDIKQYYLNNDYSSLSSALRNAIVFNLFPRGVDSTEYYYNIRYGDNLEKNPFLFSAASCLELVKDSTIVGYKYDPTSGHDKMNRVLRTYIKRAVDNDPVLFSDERAVLILKYLLSEMRWFSQEGEFLSSTNHGALIDLPYYWHAVSTLNYFKDYSENSERNWIELTGERTKIQLDHILPDGIFDEHSATYNFLVSEKYNNLMRYYFNNKSRIPVRQDIIQNMSNAIQRQYQYFIYMVSPVKNLLNSSDFNYFGDIPPYGDGSACIVNKWTGKNDPNNIKKSILTFPITEDYVGYWHNTKLKNNLLFTGYPEIPGSGQPPDSESKAFPVGGYYVGRSNWVKNDGAYDYNARYFHFKGGEFLPTNGPYNGYKTNSTHIHADLLNLDIAGYGKNILTESGGYIPPGLTYIVEEFNQEYYYNLYHYLPDFDDYDIVRSYFKLTPGHNTVYVNNESLALYCGEYCYSNYKNIESEPIEYYTGSEFDFVSGKVIKNGENGYTHQRDVFYVKPPNLNEIKNDYLIVIDKISVVEGDGGRAEQIWHVSLDQAIINSDTDELTLQGKNFFLVSPSDYYDVPVSAEILNGYMVPNDSLFEGKIFRFVQSSDSVSDFLFATIIYPCANSSEYLPPIVKKQTIFDSFGQPFNFRNIMGLSIEISRNNGETITDYFIHTEDENPQYKWKSKFDENFRNGNSNYQLSRYTDGEETCTLILNNEMIINGKITEDNNLSEYDFYLKQNYPNPFNPTTKIEYSIPAGEKVELVIFDILGRKVRTLVNEYKPAGNYIVEFNAGSFSSGIYICRLTSGKYSSTGKMLLLK